MKEACARAFLLARVVCVARTCVRRACSRFFLATLATYVLQVWTTQLAERVAVIGKAPEDPLKRPAAGELSLLSSPGHAIELKSGEIYLVSFTCLFVHFCMSTASCKPVRALRIQKLCSAALQNSRCWLQHSVLRILLLGRVIRRYRRKMPLALHLPSGTSKFQNSSR